MLTASGSSEAATLPAGPSKARGVVSFILRLLDGAGDPDRRLRPPVRDVRLPAATTTPTGSLVVGVAIVVGVGGVFALYWAMDRLVDLLPERFREGVRPYVFVGRALVILASS